MLLLLWWLHRMLLRRARVMYLGLCGPGLRHRLQRRSPYRRHRRTLVVLQLLLLWRSRLGRMWSARSRTSPSSGAGARFGHIDCTLCCLAVPGSGCVLARRGESPATFWWRWWLARKCSGGGLGHGRSLVRKVVIYVPGSSLLVMGVVIILKAFAISPFKQKKVLSRYRARSLARVAWPG